MLYYYLYLMAHYVVHDIYAYYQLGSENLYHRSKMHKLSYDECISGVCSCFRTAAFCVCNF